MAGPGRPHLPRPADAVSLGPWAPLLSAVRCLPRGLRGLRGARVPRAFAALVAWPRGPSDGPAHAADASPVGGGGVPHQWSCRPERRWAGGGATEASLPSLGLVSRAEALSRGAGRACPQPSPGVGQRRERGGQLSLGAGVRALPRRREQAYERSRSRSRPRPRVGESQVTKGKMK